jgi:hypothetical protein
MNSKLQTMLEIEAEEQEALRDELEKKGIAEMQRSGYPLLERDQTQAFKDNFRAYMAARARAEGIRVLLGIYERNPS